MLNIIVKIRSMKFKIIIYNLENLRNSKYAKETRAVGMCEGLYQMQTNVYE